MQPNGPIPLDSCLLPQASPGKLQRVEQVAPAGRGQELHRGNGVPGSWEAGSGSWGCLQGLLGHLHFPGELFLRWQPSGFQTELLAASATVPRVNTGVPAWAPVGKEAVWERVLTAERGTPRRREDCKQGSQGHLLSQDISGLALCWSRGSVTPSHLGYLALEPGQHLGRGKRTMPVAPGIPLWSSAAPHFSGGDLFVPSEHRETQVTPQEVGFGG